MSNNRMCKVCGCDNARLIQVSGNTNTTILCEECIPPNLTCSICNAKTKCKIDKTYPGCRFCMEILYVNMDNTRVHYSYCSSEHAKLFKRMCGNEENLFKVCAECRATSKDFKSCARCMDVSYCDVSCQKKHWPSHKVICERMIGK